MKKVMIFTLHEAENIGAFWQAFSLQEVLKEKGCQVALAKFPDEGKNRISKVLKSLNFKRLLFKYNTHKKFLKNKKILQLEAFSHDCFYENAVIGSDEVWNLDSNTFVHREQYLGKNINSENIIAYAPSVNDFDLNGIHGTEFNLDSFKHLSGRDTNTIKVIQSRCGKEVIQVLDPTLLFQNYEKYEICTNANNYILVYSYGLSEEAIKNIKKFAKEVKCKLYSVGTYNSWCDKNIVVSPFEFLGYLKNADYIITSTFHGTLLSLIYHKNIAVYVQNNFKVQDILETLQIPFCKVDDNQNLYNYFKDNHIDYNDLEEFLKSKRRESLNYLEEALL